MKPTILLFVLMVSGLNSPLSAQNWIPRLNKNGAYTLVTDQGSPVNQVQYENVSPLWDGDQYAAWTLNNTSGCIFPNKVSIAYEPNPRVYKDYKIKAIVEKGAKAKDAWKDYRYLVDFAKHNLIVNLKTGKYVVDYLKTGELYNLRNMPYFPARNGLLKVNKPDNWVNFVNADFKEVLPAPIKNGEALDSGLFIAQDTVSRKYGLVNMQGKLITPYVFDRLELLPIESHLLAAIAVDKNPRAPKYKYGMLDIRGKLLLDTVYSEIKPFLQQLYVVRTGNNTAVLDKSMRPIFPAASMNVEQPFKVLPDRNPYLFVLNQNDTNRPKQNFSVLDTTGKVVLSEEGTNFRLLPDGDFLVLTKGTGEKLVYSFQKGFHFIFRDTLQDIYLQTGEMDTLYVKRKKGAVQVYTRSGEKLGLYPFDVIFKLKDTQGFIAIKDEKFGIIDAAGAVVLPLTYDNVYDVKVKDRSRYYTCFKTGDTREYGVYNDALKKWQLFKTEKDATEYLYPNDFKVKLDKNQLYGVTNAVGKVLIPAEYNSIKQMLELPVFACYEAQSDQWKIINAKNEVIHSFAKTEKKNIPYPYFMRQSGNFAISNGVSTLYLEKDSYKKLSAVDLVYLEGICISSYEHKGWTTMYKPGIENSGRHPVWVNYFTGKAYLEE